MEFSCSLAPTSHAIFQTIPTPYSGWFSPLLLYQLPTGLGAILPYFGLTSKHGVALSDRSGPHASLFCQLSLEDPQCPPTPGPDPHHTHHYAKVSAAQSGVRPCPYPPQLCRSLLGWSPALCRSPIHQSGPSERRALCCADQARPLPLYSTFWPAPPIRGSGIHRGPPRAPGLLCCVSVCQWPCPVQQALCLIPWCGEAARSSILCIQGTVSDWGHLVHRAGLEAGVLSVVRESSVHQLNAVCCAWLSPEPSKYLQEPVCLLAEAVHSWPC